MKNETTILDDAQYNNFFRNLAELVYSDNFPTWQEKRDALISQIKESENSSHDLINLSELVSWFDGYEF